MNLFPTISKKSFANFTRTLCTRNLKTSINDVRDNLAAFIAHSLIPLNNNSGIPPICVEEVIRQIARKVTIDTGKKYVQQLAGSLQVCADQDEGAEAVFQAMYNLFQWNETEVVLVADAENAFHQ